MKSDLALWVISAMAAFLLFRLLTRRPSVPAVSDYEAEIHDILTNEKYKVKGRFE